MTISERLLLLFVLVAVPAVFIGVPIFIFTGGPQKFALRPLLRAFAGVESHEQFQPGDVSFVYHTYRGFLIWFVQSEHRVFAPPDSALLILKRLLRFNLTWGMLSYGMLFVPFVAVGNYISQKNSIDRQRKALTQSAFALSNSCGMPSEVERNFYASPRTDASAALSSRSRFRQVVGWICAGLCLLFGITTVVCFANADFEPAIGGLFVSVLLGSTSWTWIRKPA